MPRDEKHPDIFALKSKANDSHESDALDEALLDAVDGLAKSLREDEQTKRRDKQREAQRQHWSLMTIVFLLLMVVPVLMIGFPHWFQPSPVETAPEPPVAVTEQPSDPQPFAAMPPASRTQGIDNDSEPKTTNEPQRNTADEFNPLDDPQLKSGQYTMLLPRGFKWQVTLRALGDRKYLLSSKHNLNSLGVYQLKEDRLVMIDPNDEQLTEFEWLVTSDATLELVAEPPARKTGARYLGTSLTRNPEVE